MQEHSLLAKAMGVKEVVETTDDIVGSLSTFASFIGKKIYLSRYCFTMHSKHRALSGCQKVYRARLEWITREVHLLRIIK